MTALRIITISCGLFWRLSHDRPAHSLDAARGIAGLAWLVVLVTFGGSIVRQARGPARPFDKVWALVWMPASTRLG
jgi:hypothetical protein